MLTWGTMEGSQWTCQEDGGMLVILGLRNQCGKKLAVLGYLVHRWCLKSCHGWNCKDREFSMKRRGLRHTERLWR